MPDPLEQRLDALEARLESVLEALERQDRRPPAPAPASSGGLDAGALLQILLKRDPWAEVERAAALVQSMRAGDQPTMQDVWAQAQPLIAHMMSRGAAPNATPPAAAGSAGDAQ